MALGLLTFFSQKRLCAALEVYFFYDPAW